MHLLKLDVISISMLMMLLEVGVICGHRVANLIMSAFLV